MNEPPDTISKRSFNFIVAWATSFIVAGALLCTLLAKLYWAIHVKQISQYPGWIAADIAVLAAVELLCAIICFFWRRNWAARSTLVFAALVCTWSVINAGWLIATGTQVLPAVLLPLFFNPLSRLIIVGHHLAIRPLAAAAILAPSAVALAFFFYVLAKPLISRLTKKHIQTRLIIYAILLVACGIAAKISQTNAETKTFAELRYNSQFVAVKSTLAGIIRNKNPKTTAEWIRKIPLAEANQIPLQNHKKFAEKFNIVIIVLEGISPEQTNLFNEGNANVPFLAELAGSSAAFTNCRTTTTHTTKALFAIHTGRYPSVSQDYIEAAVKNKPYQSITTILESYYQYRTAFFQSAAGTFEARPGLVHNLGFNNFFAREDIPDANTYLGYLAADEFALIEPVCDWIKQSDQPFLITILGSAMHDPYESPRWYKPANRKKDEPVKKYLSLIEYTDSFLAAFYKNLMQVTDKEKTIFCVIGDHGEAFGQHGRYGHARIPYDEVLKVFWFIKSPKLIKKPVRIDLLVSIIDVVPTLLGLLGFDTTKADFDGINVLKTEPVDRNLFFSTWTNDGPAGFISGRQKFIYDPTNRMIIEFNIAQDTHESRGRFISKKDSKNQTPLIAEILKWQKETFISLQPDSTEKYQRIFDNWLCQTNNREPRAVYDRP
jgi:phosphoglycerol transferase MdoB-like AlkP superfamily enzyme